MNDSIETFVDTLPIINKEIFDDLLSTYPLLRKYLSQNKEIFNALLNYFLSESCKMRYAISCNKYIIPLSKNELNCTIDTAVRSFNIFAVLISQNLSKNELIELYPEIKELIINL